METIEVTKMTAEMVLETVEDYSTEIYDALHSSTKSIDEWYFAYTLTDNYKNLKVEDKKKMFDYFGQLRHLFEQLDTFLWHNKKGEYSDINN